MATLKKWSAFFNRTNLSDNDNGQVMILDTTVVNTANRNQRTPVTQILRSGKNLSDLASASTAVTNLGATSTNTANALARRDGSGNFSMAVLTASGGNFSAGVSGFNITGTNASCNIGTKFTISQSSVSNGFFNGSAVGDCCIRQTDTTLSLLMGVGSATAQQQITNTAINFRVNPNITSGTNPTLTVGTNTVLAQSSAAGTFFTNGNTGDSAISQRDTTKSIRLGVANGSQTSGLDISLTQVTVNLATLACAGSLTVAVNATITGTLSSLSLSTGVITAGAITATSLTLPTTGGTPAALDYYEDNSTSDFNITVSTPDGTNHNLPLRVVRTGKMVVISSAGLSVTSNSAARFVAASGQVPSRWRPQFDLDFIDNVEDNSAPVTGLIAIKANGGVDVGVGLGGGNFTNTGTAAIKPFSFSYPTS
jgi:hypothetical protein